MDTRYYRGIGWRVESPPELARKNEAARERILSEILNTESGRLRLRQLFPEDGRDSFCQVSDTVLKLVLGEEPNKILSAKFVDPLTRERVVIVHDCDKDGYVVVCGKKSRVHAEYSAIPH